MEWYAPERDFGMQNETNNHKIYANKILKEVLKESVEREERRTRWKKWDTLQQELYFNKKILNVKSKFITVSLKNYEIRKKSRWSEEKLI